MKIFLIFFISLAVIISIMLGFVFYLNNESNEFSARHETFVRNFISEFSKTWRIGDHKNQFSKNFLKFYQSAKSQQVINYYKSLGPLVKIEDFKLTKYDRDNQGVKGEFVFTGKFSHAEAVVTFILRENELGLTIEDIDIRPREFLEQGKRIPA